MYFNQSVNPTMRGQDVPKAAMFKKEAPTLRPGPPWYLPALRPNAGMPF
jgi:hypothetical protein